MIKFSKLYSMLSVHFQNEDAEQRATYKVRKSEAAAQVRKNLIPIINFTFFNTKETWRSVHLQFLFFKSFKKKFGLNNSNELPIGWMIGLFSRQHRPRIIQSLIEGWSLKHSREQVTKAERIRTEKKEAAKHKKNQAEMSVLLSPPRSLCRIRGHRCFTDLCPFH